MVRIYEREIEVFTLEGRLLRRHDKSETKSAYKLLPEDRIFNPSRGPISSSSKITLGRAPG